MMWAGRGRNPEGCNGRSPEGRNGRNPEGCNGRSPEGRRIRDMPAHASAPRAPQSPSTPLEDGVRWFNRELQMGHSWQHVQQKLTSFWGPEWAAAVAAEVQRKAVAEAEAAKGAVAEIGHSSLAAQHLDRAHEGHKPGANL